ncbi:hypothetical protein MJ588_01000 [Klebsiella pneumoniae]|nr:hypothetical protein MJ588_01000 [Klebsiella pneumoniae]
MQRHPAADQSKTLTARNAAARFARAAQAMGVDTRGMSDAEAASMGAINAIRTLSKRVGIPQSL